MAYEFTPQMTIGDELIDSQHKELLDVVNRLGIACNDGKAMDEIGGIIDYLVDYTVKHFHDEETLQLKVGFPGYMEHRGLHKDFKKKVTQLLADMETGGATSKLVVKVSVAVGDWLIRHIKQEDAKIGKWIRSQ